MRRLLPLLSLLFALPAAAFDAPRPFAQVPMLPVSGALPEDVRTLVRAHWAPYFETADPAAFHTDTLRLGRFDLNGDGKAELFVMIAHPAWEAEHGKPLAVATWTRKGWVTVGWSWGDEDTLFATEEVQGGWRGLDTGTQLLRWSRFEYQRIEKKAE